MYRVVLQVVGGVSGGAGGPADGRIRGVPEHTDGGARSAEAGPAGPSAAV